MSIQKQVLTLAAFWFSVFIVEGSDTEIVISGVSLLLIGLPIFFGKNIESENLLLCTFPTNIPGS